MTLTELGLFLIVYIITTIITVKIILVIMAYLIEKEIL